MDSIGASTKSWIRAHVPHPKVMMQCILAYILTLLPLPLWILTYNWLHVWEDAAAGIALSMVVIPQSIGFGLLTHISPMHGLYSTFAGLVLY